MKEKTEDVREKKNIKRERLPRFFTIQWHVTAKCPNKCAHCYLQESEGYKSEIKNELSLEKCFKIIDDFSVMTTAWGLQGRINFTGGDPLLKDEMIKLIDYAHDHNILMGILGNPELLDDKTVVCLKDHGVTSYQLSIDGMKETHDRLRRKGSFEKTLEGIRLLNKYNLRSVVMFTLSKENINDLISVINLVAKEKVSIFDFARIVPIGNGVQFKEQQIKPEEYRSLLLRVLEEYRRLKSNGCNTYFGRKDHLWRLLYKELGLLPALSEDRETIFHGCSIGIHFLTIVADGTVYPCRRLPIKIGEVPKQKLRDIFIGSAELNKMRQVERLEKCSKCDLLQYCRGCPAVAYGTSGNYFSADPQCWARI